MSLTRWRGPAALPAVVDEMDRMFDRYFREPILRTFEDDSVDFGPSVDVYETDTQVVVKAHLPGVKKEDIELTVQEDRLLLTGESRHEDEVEEEGYHRRELRYGRFRRVLPMPAAVDHDEITAAFEDGVLTVRAPKTEQKTTGKSVEIT